MTIRLRNWLGRFAGILFGLMMTWLMLEILLRLFFGALPVTYQQIIRNVHVTPFTETTILPAPVWQPDSTYLHINRPVKNYAGYGSAEVRYLVNTETLWNSRVAFRTTQAQVDRHVDAVAIGDSFTFCFTDEEDCWVTRLGEKTGRNIVNMGIVGTGTVSHERILRDFGLPLKPELVIWQWFGNDPNEDFGLAQLNGETAILPPDDVPAARRNLTWLHRNSAAVMLLDTLLRHPEDQRAFTWTVPQQCTQPGSPIDICFGQPYLWGAFDPNLPGNAYGWERTRSAFSNAQDMASGYGGRLVVVLIPPAELVYRELAEPLVGADHYELLAQNHERITALCQAEALTCLDLLPEFRAYAPKGEQLYYRSDMHLNPYGNEVMAEVLAHYLTTEKIIK